MAKGHQRGVKSNLHLAHQGEPLGGPPMTEGHLSSGTGTACCVTHRLHLPFSFSDRDALCAHSSLSGELDEPNSRVPCSLPPLHFMDEDRGYHASHPKALPGTGDQHNTAPDNCCACSAHEKTKTGQFNGWP